MDRYLHQTDEQNRLLLSAAAERMPLAVQSIEKDFWVCWLMRTMAQLSGIGPHLTFKGGTSLSKAYALIERFSEDIDLVVDRNIFGIDGSSGAFEGLSPRQAKERAKKIAKACYAWVEVHMVPAVRSKLAATLGSRRWSLELLPLTEHQETGIVFHYPKLYGDGSGYLRPEVKVELVAKADAWPSRPMPIRSYLQQLFPEVLGDDTFNMNTMQAERTMLEKALLLHETLVTRPEGPRPRLARHYYDLYQLSKAGFAERSIADPSLYPAIIEHRRIFYRYGSVDYDALLSEGFSIIPQGDARKEWEKDYVNMQRDMFYGDVPSFATVMEQLAQFEDNFRKHLQLQHQNNI